ncbi:General stress protein 69 [compost metagenome]
MGMSYGISNESGKISESDAIKIVRKSITEGVEFLDTASAYGDSERVLGKALKNGWASRVKIITKLDPMADLETLSNDVAWRFATRSSVLESCYRLNIEKIDFLMLHRAAHLNNIAIMSELQELKTLGVIGEIGASVQSPSELEEALSCQDVKIIQMPFNILDHRWDSLIPKILEAKGTRNVLIHARSTVLQGLLQSNDPKAWNKAKIDNHADIIRWLDQTYKDNHKMSVTDLCIGYANSQNWIDSVVVGIDNLEQLYSNLQSVSMPLMSNESINKVNKHKPRINEGSLNPKNWGTQ